VAFSAGFAQKGYAQLYHVVNLIYYSGFACPSKNGLEFVYYILLG
jgi:hypothetical protein